MDFVPKATLNASVDFNANQREAIESNSGSLLVLAGPGTGKTRVLIAKIQALVKSGIKPDRILAITFSNKATSEIEERLLLQTPELVERVDVMTIHSWCQELVRREGFRLGFHQPAQLMTESQAQLFFRDLSHRLPIESFVKTANVDAVLEELLDLLGRCKDEGLWPEDLIRFGQKMEHEEWEKLGDLYSAYQNFCLQRGFLDFGDVILFALRLLQDYQEVRTKTQESYDAILVDEFQDTNWSQVELLKKMAGPSAHICAVGDDDQAIYRFRGASYSAFQYFENAFPNSKVVSLTETYRLSPEIAKVASTLIRANGTHRFRPNKIIKSVSASRGPVKVCEFASHEDEAAVISESIAKLLKEGVSPGEIGILGRSHRSLDLITRKLFEAGIPFQSSAGEALFEQPLIQDVLSILRLIENPSHAVDLVRLLDSPFLQCSEEEILRFCREASLQRKPWIEFLSEFKSENSALQSFSKTFMELKAHAYRRSLSETLFEIWEKTGIVKKLIGTSEDELKTLAQFHSQIFEWEKNQERKDAISLLRQLEVLFKNETSLDTTWEKAIDKVSLMTVHASKGLEFDHIYVVGLVGRRFPANFQRPTWTIPEGLSREAALTKEGHIEEERRLLYVAMTRARKALNLTTVDRKGVKPSLFIAADLKSLQPETSTLLTEKIPERYAAGSLLGSHENQPFQRASKSKTPASRKNDKPLHLSFTQLDRYDRCPRAYFFAHELKIPSPPSPSLVFGSAAHSALEGFFKSVIRGEIPPQEELILDFDRALEKEALQTPHIPLERIRETGRAQLKAYYEWHQGEFPKPKAIEEKFKLKIGDHLLSGKIDRADSSPEGMVIIDYKTGRSKSSADEDDQKFAEESLQFSIYALAAKDYFKWPLKELRFHYLSDNSELSTTRSSKDLEATRSKITEMATAIQNQKFEATPNTIVCRHCDYSRICPSAQI